MNPYSANLILPFELDLRASVERECDEDRLGHFSYDPQLLPNDLSNWFRSIGVWVSHAEVFHTPRMSRLPMHIDGGELSNIAKLNWCFGASGSVMNWFKLKDPNGVLESKKTGIGSNYLKPNEKDCRLVHSAKIGTPTLVNVGQIHSVINPTQERRWVLSCVLSKIGGVDRVHFADAVELMGPWVD